jgi:hypothetical protein
MRERVTTAAPAPPTTRSRAVVSPACDRDRNAARTRTPFTKAGPRVEPAFPLHREVDRDDLNPARSRNSLPSLRHAPGGAK